MKGSSHGGREAARYKEVYHGPILLTSVGRKPTRAHESAGVNPLDFERPDPFERDKHVKESLIAFSESLLFFPGMQPREERLQKDSRSLVSCLRRERARYSFLAWSVE